MSGEVVADCDALTVLLVHYQLTAQLKTLLARCGWQVRTLNEVHGREATDKLRQALDGLRASGQCVLVPHPEKQELDKKQRKRWRQIDESAQKRHRVVSQNDRGLFYEAQSGVGS